MMQMPLRHVRCTTSREAERARRCVDLLLYHAATREGAGSTLGLLLRPLPGASVPAPLL
jgi:hypothetical protein